MLIFFSFFFFTCISTYFFMYCMNRKLSALRANMWETTCLPVSYDHFPQGYNIVPVNTD